MLLKDLPVLIVDCQTTGASPQYGHILELGWSHYQPMSDQDEPIITARLIKQPDDTILPERIKKITGITDSDMETAYSPIDVINELAAVVAASSASPLLAVAHWAQFEQSFISDFYATHDDSQLPFAFVCTCQIAKRLFPDLPSRAIRALGGYLGLTIDQEKRASGHVLATAYIWRELLPRLEAQGITTYEQLVSFMGRPLPKKSKAANAYELPLEKLKRLELPDKPGVYKMLGRTGKILYVGKATSLKSRVNSYFRGRKGKDSKTKELISQIHNIETIEVATPLEAALLETDLIKEHNPPYNRALLQKGRNLVFYSRDFDLVSSEQSARCPIGPFVGEQAMMPLLVLTESLITGEFSEELFWNLAPLEIIEEGVALFIDNYLDQGGLTVGTVESLLNGALSLTSDVTVRGLLALGLKLYRDELNSPLQYERDNQDSDIDTALLSQCSPFDEADQSDQAMRKSIELQLMRDDDQLSEEDEEDDDDDEEAEIDAFAIEEMIVGILRRSAKMYWQCQSISRALNCQVLFREGKLPLRRLTFASGKIINAEAVDSAALSEDLKHHIAGLGSKAKNKSYALLIPAVAPQYPWQDLSIDTYDRCRVLMTELGRLIARGRLLPLRQLVYASKSQDLDVPALNVRGSSAATFSAS